MSENRVNLVFYGDFGLRRGKGEEVWATAEALYRAGLLGKIYVRDKGNAKGTKFEKHIIVPIPGGNLLPRIFSGAERFILPSFHSRIWGERVFDFFTSLKLEKGGRILYTAIGSPRTLRKAKRLGYKVGLHCGVLHPRYNLEILKGEFEKFDLSFPDNIFIKELKKREKVLGFFDFIVVHSKYAKENYSRYGVPLERLFINPLGVNLKMFRPVLKDSSEKTFLFIGSLCLLKGVHYLLEAWKQLNLKDAKLIVCGRKEIEDWPLIKKYQNLPNVEFPGFVNPIDYYKKASVFILPSLTEGFPRVVGEAMASALPVIVTPPAAEMVRDGVDGFVVPLRNVEALKEKILYFYNNPEKAIEMGKNARQFTKCLLRLLHHIGNKGSP